MNRTMTASARKTAATGRIRSYYEFATHTRASSLAGACTTTRHQPTQSPAIIVGLYRITTSLWTCVVASPQRVPVCRYRPRG